MCCTCFLRYIAHSRCKIKPLSVKISIGHALQLCNGAVCQLPHFGVHIRQGSQHPRHCAAAVRSVVHTDQIFFFHAKIHSQTSISYCLLRAAAFFGLAVCFVSESCLRTEARGLRMFLSRFSFLSISA